MLLSILLAVFYDFAVKSSAPLTSELRYTVCMISQGLVMRFGATKSRFYLLDVKNNIRIKITCNIEHSLTL